MDVNIFSRSEYREIYSEVYALSAKSVQMYTLCANEKVITLDLGLFRS